MSKNVNMWYNQSLRSFLCLTFSLFYLGFGLTQSCYYYFSNKADSLFDAGAFKLAANNYEAASICPDANSNDISAAIRKKNIATTTYETALINATRKADSLRAEAELSARTFKLAATAIREELFQPNLSIQLITEANQLSRESNPIALETRERLINQHLFSFYKNIPVTGGLRQAAFTPDNQFLLTMSSDLHVQKWDMGGNQLSDFSLNEPDIFYPMITKLGHVFYIQNNQYVLVNEDGKTIRKIQGNNYVNQVEFSPDDKFLIINHEDSTTIWDVENNKLIPFNISWSGYSTFQLQKNGFFAYNGDYASVWNWKLELQDSFKVETPIYAYCVSPDLRFLAYSMANINFDKTGNTNLIRNIATRKTIPFAQSETVNNIVFTNFSDQFVIYKEPSILETWTVEGIKVNTFERLNLQNIAQNIAVGFEENADFQDFDKSLAATPKDGGIISNAYFQPVIISDNDRFVLSNIFKNTVTVWDKSLGILHKILDQDDYINEFEVSSDGNYAFTSDGYTYRLWLLTYNFEKKRIFNEETSIDQFKFINNSTDVLYLDSGKNQLILSDRENKKIKTYTSDQKIIAFDYLPKSNLIAALEGNFVHFISSTNKTDYYVQIPLVCNNIHFSDDNLLLTSSGGLVMQTDLQGKVLSQWKTGFQSGNLIHFSDDGSRIIVLNYDKPGIKVFNSKGKLLAFKNDQSARDIVVDAQNETIYFYSADEEAVFQWQYLAGNTRKLMINADRIFAFSSFRKELIAGDYYEMNTDLIFADPNGNIIRKVENLPTIRNLFSNGEDLVVCNSDSVKFYKWPFQMISQFSYPELPAFSTLQDSRQGLRILSYQDNKLYLTDSAGIVIKNITLEANILNAVLSPAATLALVSTMNNQLYLVDIVSEKIRLVPLNKIPVSFDFNADGALFWCSQNDSTILVWDAALLKVKYTYEDANIIEKAGFVGQDKLLTINATGGIKWWTLEEDPLVSNINLTEGIMPVSLATSPGQNELFAVSCNDKEVYLFSLKKNTRKVLNNNSNPIYDLQFSEDGNWLSTINSDKTLEFWNTNSTQPIISPSASILSYDFSSHHYISEGKRLAIITGSGIVIYDQPLVAIQERIAPLSISNKIKYGVFDADSCLLLNNALDIADCATYYAQHDTLKAIKLYEKSLELNPDPVVRKKLTDLLELVILNIVDEDEKVRFQKKIISNRELNFRDKPDLENAGIDLMYAYGNQSYYLLFQKNYEEGIRMANKALEMNIPESYKYYIYINLAHGLLLSGQFNEAYQLYDQYKDKYQNNKTVRNIILEDFDKLELASITHPDFQKIRQLVKEYNQKGYKKG